MTAKLYKIYPQYEGLTGIRTGKSKILPVKQVLRRGKWYLVVDRSHK